MYNLGDDSELDRLSREAAGRYETPGNANWQALSKELDKVLPEEKKKRRFLFWWLLPALLAGGVITYSLVTQNEHNTASTEKNIPVVSTDKSQEQSTTQSTPIQKNNAAVTAADKKTVSPAGTAVTPATPKITENITASLNERKTGTINPSIKKGRKQIGLLSAKPPVVPVKIPNSSIGKEETTLTTAKQSMITTEIAKTADQPIVIKVQKEVTKESSQTEQPQAATTVTDKAEKEGNKEELVQDDKKMVKANLLPARGKGWSFGLLAGVDKSTVKFKYGYKPGINLGLEIAYHFNDQWAVKTGGIFTRKNYKLVGEDFTAPKGTPISYYKLDVVEGSCYMWEVPLLVSYTLNKSGRKSVTLNTGLSSYFMTHEDYSYYYVYNGSPTSKHASYNSTDTHILSIAHLSAGFENRLSKTMSLQIEPYAKIPLGGVGFGDIKLSSFGVNLSVQYRQPHKK